MKRKRSLSLIELLVGLGLMTLLLSSVLMIYSQSIQMSSWDAAKKREVRAAHDTQKRLDYFFARVNKQDFYVLPSENSLVFSYRGEIDLNPVFGKSEIIARLFVDPETQQLTLIRWPKKKNEIPEDWQKEVLQEKVESLSFSFAKLDSELAQIIWQEDWEEDFLPVMLSLKIVFLDSREQSWTFHLSSEQHELPMGV